MDPERTKTQLERKEYLYDDVIDGFTNYLIHVSGADAVAVAGVLGHHLHSLSEKKKIEVLGHKITLIPIIENSHWTLSVLCNERKEIHYYDSLGKPPSVTKKRVKQVCS